MTNNIVKRLRHKVAVSRIYDDDERLTDAAADRIEALEKALREKEDFSYVVGSHGMTHGSFTIVYLTALGEKKND